MTHAAILNKLLSIFENPTYLEIGVNKGDTFSKIIAQRKVAVDPHFTFDVIDSANHAPNTVFHEIESDHFFSRIAKRYNRFDVIFIDGQHTFEQTLRDFCNSIMFLADDGIIVIDDVCPSSYHAAMPNLAASFELRRHLHLQDRDWMGDVYKLVFFIETFFPQFNYATIKETHGQTVVWRAPRHIRDEQKKSVNAIASLPFEAVFLHRGAYNIASFDEIFSTLQRLKVTRTDEIADVIRSGAEAATLSTRQSDWAAELDIRDGEKTLVDAGRFRMTSLNCPNADLFGPLALKLLDTYESRSFEFATPSCRAYAMENVTILSFGTTMAQSRLVLESIRPIPQAFYEQVEADLGVTPCSARSDLPIAVVEQPLIENYGHWMIDIFPKIFAIRAQIQSGKIRVGLSSVPSFVKQTLQLAGLDPNCIHVVSAPERVERAIYVSPVSEAQTPGGISRYAIDVARRISADVTGGTQKKIFISRRDAAVRRLWNEEEVTEIVKQYGYDTICCGDLSVPEQIAVFKGATHVIGVFGASLTNLAFCKDKIRAMIICPGDYIDHFYWGIASHKKMNLYYMNGKIERNEEDESRPLHHLDFSVDIPAFVTALQKFEAGERFHRCPP